MDRIVHAISEATAFGRENRPDCAYYKYIRTIHLVLELLEENVFFTTTSPRPETIGRLFKLCDACISRAEDNLNVVLDMDEKDAESACEAGIIGFSTYLKREEPTARTKKLELDTILPYQEASIDSTENIRRAKVLEDRSEYGPEPELGLRDDGLLPLIPASNLYVLHCQRVYEIQLLVQKLEQFTSATAKQQGNGIYITSLRHIIDKLRRLTMAKLQAEEGIQLCQGKRVRDLPPADFARQITLIQLALLQKVQPEELKTWRGFDRQQAMTMNPNLKNFMAFSTYLTHWCQYEILRYVEENDRSSVLVHMIRITCMLRDMGNFDGLKAIVTGLTARPIHRLRKTSALLPKRLGNELESLKTLVNERRNYAQLRYAMRKRASPLIPSIGVILNDREGLEEHLIRWNEFITSAYEELYTVQLTVQHYLISQPFRWEEELQAISELREPSGRRIKDLEGQGIGEAERSSPPPPIPWNYGESELYEGVRRNILLGTSNTADILSQTSYDDDYSSRSPSFR